MASPSAGATTLKYGDVNTVTPSHVEVKGLMGMTPMETSKITEEETINKINDLKK